MAMFGLWGDNPYNASAEYMEQIPGIQEQYLAPYSEMSQRLLTPLTMGYGAMALQPGAVQAGLGSSFEASPGYDWEMDQALQAQNQAMAASGMSGSPESQQFAADTAENMANREYQQYLQNQMRIAGTGLSGLQGIETQGYGASQSMADAMTNYLYAMAGLAGAQQKNRQNIALGGIGTGLGLMMAPSTGGATAAPVVAGNI